MTDNQWKQFRELFPQAARWLDNCNLENEHQSLTIEYKRMTKIRGTWDVRDRQRIKWLESRLIELSFILSKGKRNVD